MPNRGPWTSVEEWSKERHHEGRLRDKDAKERAMKNMEDIPPCKEST
jgi:hypothetical protein